MMHCKRALAACVLAVAIGCFAEAADDDLPPFLQDMQESVHRSETAAAQARHNYVKAKARAAKNTHTVTLEVESIRHPYMEKDQSEDDAEDVGPTDRDANEPSETLEAVDEDMTAEDGGMTAVMDPEDPTAEGKGVEPMDDEEVEEDHDPKEEKEAPKEKEEEKPVEIKAKPVDMMATAAKMQAEAQAAAKLQYENSMAKMKKLSQQFGEEAKVYEARSKKAGVEEKAAAKVEKTQVKTALAAFPWLATGLTATKTDITKDAVPSKKEKTLDSHVDNSLAGFGLKHKEVPKLIDTVSAKHAKFKNPMDALKQMQTDLQEENGRQATSMMHWQALTDGWKGPISPPDEGDVRAEARAIEVNAEKTSGHKLNKDQRSMILEATRAHDMDMKRINRAQKRLRVMEKLVTHDDRDAKKTLATEQAEGMLDENDGMQAKVNAAEAEAHMALQQQKMAVPDAATTSLMRSLQEIQKKAAVYEQAKEAEEAVEEMQ